MAGFQGFRLSRQRSPSTRKNRRSNRELQEIDAWLANQPMFSILNIDYRAVLDDPLSQAESVNSFLGGGLDCPAMATMVDKALYRSRGS